VNGPETCELYRWLRQHSVLNQKNNGQKSSCKPITWNYAKLLVDRNGNVKKYYDPTQPRSPKNILPDI